MTFRGGFKKKGLPAAVVVFGCVAAAAPAGALFSGSELLAALLTFFSQKLGPALEDARITNTTEIRRASDANVIALGRVGDILRQTEIDIFNSQTQQRMEPPPNACRSLTTAQSVKTTALASDEVVSGLEVPVMASAVGASNPASHTSARLERHAQNYCSKQDVELGFCAAEGAMPNWDLSADHLLTPRKYDPEQQAAAEAMVVNLIAPSAPPAPDAELASTPAGDAAKAALLTNAARKSVAANSLSRIVAERAALGPEETSVRQLMQDEVDRRFGAEDWVNKIMAGSPEAVLREQVIMDALRLKMDLMRYEQSERIEMLIASLLALQTDTRHDDTYQTLLTTAQRRVDE